MLLMHANNREDIEEAFAGDIVALAGLKDTTTGDTLCDPTTADHPRADGIPRAGHRDRGRAEDQGRPGEDGRRAAASWPPRIRPSASRPITESGQTSSRAWASFTSTSSSTACAASTRSRPTSARRRWPIARRSASTVEIDYTHKKQTGGTGQFARVKIVFEPGEPGSGFIFENEDHRRLRSRRNIIPGVEKGLEVGQGTRARWSASRSSTSRSTLIDGAYHDVDSSASGLRNRRARGASAKLPQKARHQAARADHEGRSRDARRIIIGDVIGDLNSPSRPDPGHRQPRQRHRSSRRWCRWPTCSAT